MLMQGVEIAAAQSNLSRGLIPQQVAGLVADKIQRQLVARGRGLTRHGGLLAGNAFGLTALDGRRVGSNDRALRRVASNFGLYGTLQVGNFAHRGVQLAHRLLQQFGGGAGEQLGHLAPHSAPLLERDTGDGAFEQPGSGCLTLLPHGTIPDPDQGGRQ